MLFKKRPYLLPIFIGTIFFASQLFASTESGDTTHRMMTLMLQVSAIIFVARLGGMVFTKINFPSVLGELVAGIIIGPYLLGALPLPGMPLGLFPLPAHAAFPISHELYGIATLASIILLFLAGLETDLELFIRYSLAGTIVGLGGILVSFSLGVFTAHAMIGLPILSPGALFMGVMSTATSVGITARILSERRSMESPEGVTILAGAVIDDVLGIIMLAIILGISGILAAGQGDIDWGAISFIALKTISVWLGFTLFGIIFSQKIGSFLKKIGGGGTISIMALGLALLLAGIFEHAGLAMIVGAYVMGLSLSKTDLSYIIQETLHPLQLFLVPIFFTVMGMLVDLRVFLSWPILLLGLVYSIGAILAKMVGCGIPALFLGFNKLGATRIGLGMVPRGEVALIIAGIGLSAGFLDEKIFGVSIMMTLITTIISPPLLDFSLRNGKKGTKKDTEEESLISTKFDLEIPEFTEILTNHVREYFNKEGYFITMRQFDAKIYQIRKDNSFIKMYQYDTQLILMTSSQDEVFAKTVVYEAFIKLYWVIDKIKAISLPADMRKELTTQHGSDTKICITENITEFFEPDHIIMALESDEKKGAIRELAVLLHQQNHIQHLSSVFDEIIERENVISTGMENGLAIPHARANDVERVALAVGISKQGIDFGAPGGEKSHVIALLISSTQDNDPHIKILAALASMFIKPDTTQRVMNAKSKQEIWTIFKSNMMKEKKRKFIKRERKL
ncbi:cation:proton antiporter [bacterium]|nr:cation:proton antiporter [bacterium]